MLMIGVANSRGGAGPCIPPLTIEGATQSLTPRRVAGREASRRVAGRKALRRPGDPRPNSPTWRPSCVIGALILCVLLVTPAAAQSRYSLDEPVTDPRTFLVESTVDVTGQLHTAVDQKKAVALKLSVAGKFRYRERRLPGIGRDAESLRSARFYELANAEIAVSEQSSALQLRPDRRVVIAQARREGVEVYSPTGAMSSNELELLRVPGDSLALLALLPRTPVAVEETWKPDSWAVQTLTGLEAALKGDLTCRLDSVESNLAVVSFSGSIEGATDGASTSVKLSGSYRFDLERRHIAQVELKQEEKRSVGTVSPGMEVTATATWKRSATDDPGPLTDSLLAKVPLEPPQRLVLLEFDSPWDVRFEYDRNWRLFHQTNRVAVFRLLDKGSLVAQCNLSPIPAAKAGEHTSEQQFQTDIRDSLGSKLKQIERAEQIQTDDGRFLYRVVAVGTADGLPMNWHYYLCAAPSGKQVSLVFAVEQPMLERLANRDLGIVQSLRFTDGK